MPSNPFPIIALIFMLAISLAFLAFHWRYHVKSTKLDSLAAFQQRLRAGKPVVVQFSAPL